ncbi:RDD family protein [Halobacillus sp. K22]|uniref:RDD family protein n=1 Tax=Halobacillus sp. K22 TaxID=3457431 RepID=UPI003FCDF4DC
MDQTVGFAKRFGASLLDALIVFFPIGLIAVFLLDVDTSTNRFMPNLIQSIYMIIVPVFWYGYVVGKRVMGIRIVKKDGSDVDFGTMLMRVLVSGIVYALTLGIGYLVSAFMVALRKDNRAIHDFIAGTYVTEAAPGEAVGLQYTSDLKQA